MLAVAKRRHSDSEDSGSPHESTTRLTSIGPQRRAADYIIDALERAGVDTAYGVPGGAIGPLYDALVGRSSIRVVNTRHETSAAFMAIGHVRMRPASLPCVLVTSGPGATNVVTGLAAARAEGTPLVVLAGEVPRSRFGRNALQEGSAAAIDVVHVVRSVTRFAGTITVPEHAAHQVAAACRLARAERGPVFLSIPLDVALARGAPATLLPKPVRGPELDGRAIAAAAAALETASSPLILVGSGARAAADRVRALVNRLHLPVITSPKAKGIVSEANPLCLGVFGYGGHASALAWLEQRPPDVVLALGCGFSEPSTNSWSPLLQATNTMIQVDIDAMSFGRNYRVDVAIEGDCAVALDALSLALAKANPKVHECDGVSRLEPSLDGPADVLAPGEVITALADVVPPETVFTADIGEHLLFAIHHLRSTRPNQFIAALGLGSMGSGIGAAIGAKLAAPARPVVCICGDYGFQMFGMELATCVQERLDVVFVVMNDARMRMVESGTRRIYGRGLSMDGPEIDFAALACAHGARGFVVRSVEDLFRGFLSRDKEGPTVLDARIDPNASFPANARVQALGNFVSGEGKR